MNWVPYGPRAALIRFADSAASAMPLARAITAELENHPPENLREFTIAYDQLLAEFGEDSDLAAAADSLARRLAGLLPRPASEVAPREIPVRYDGEDLEPLAAEKNLSVEEVIRRHSAVIYDVAMLGFSPGFPYLSGLDPSLAAPRLATPRSVVRAGSVAIGGSHAGIYSVASPGGWRILGHTETRLFDPSREESGMFLLRTGDRVRFVPVD